MVKREIYTALLLLFTFGLFAQNSSIPRLVSNENNVVQLLADGKLFVMLAGETENSSSSTAAIFRRWPKKCSIMKYLPNW